MNNRIKDLAEEREQECRGASRALRSRLRWLRWLNWFTVILPALIFATAGGEMITSLANPRVKFWIGVTTLLASLLVIVHKALGCDTYQSEANLLRRGYDELAKRYRTIHQAWPPDSEARFDALEDSLARLDAPPT